MSSDDISIQVRNLSKIYEVYKTPADLLKQIFFGRFGKRYYEEFWALKNVSFDVKHGECVGVIGQNGAGKSTLLQLITGTLPATSGFAKFSGRIGALLELGSGFNPEFTGRENVFLNGAILGLTKREIIQKYDEIVDFADIGDFIERPVKIYSSGMRVRLAFAVQIVTEPEILIVDEALSVGDAAFQQKCMRRMRRYMADHTVLFVSHSMGMVKNLCNRVIYLKKGEIAADGPAKSITDLYMKDLYAKEQAVDGTSVQRTEVAAVVQSRQPARWRDMRQDFINCSNLRNDLEVFQFDDSGEKFGAGGVKIVQVCFTDEKGVPLKWIVGGETVKLHIECMALHNVVSPIIGFYVKDRLGQKLFGDNTFLTYQDNSLLVWADEVFAADFTFTMPILPKGRYSVMAAVAEGTQQEHVQHEWIHDALFFESHASAVAGGLAGIPMQDIKLQKLGSITKQESK